MNWKFTCPARLAEISLILIFVFVLTACANKDRTWSSYKADAASTSYSPLSEINIHNVKNLRLAWSFEPDDAMPEGRMKGSQCNPIIVDDVMYVASARHRIYALNASDGKKIWGFDPFNGGRGGGSFRGVTYWEDGNDRRILFTAGDNLFAVDAENGKPILSFGDSGRVSMNVGIRDDPKLISIKPTSPGIIYKDLLILGNEVSELYGAQPGYIRAYNVRTGKLAWTFHTIPLPGEIGHETWPKDAWRYAGGANDWGGMSVDEKRGMVFLATGSPTYDFYGADRKGQNLFGNCVVALNAATGKHIWHFQTIHHDLWDYDLPAPPNLVTITREGRKIDAVAQCSKIGFLYLLDRETGEPLFPVEERPVPASDVPGEEVWPTQPFPTKPKPYARQMLREEDLANYSEADQDSLLKVFRGYRYEGLFTPPSVKGTINFPGTIGGSEWGGAAFDPLAQVIYLKSNESPEVDILEKIDNKQGPDQSSVQVDGKNLYMNYCASCHKADRSGNEPLYPSLIGLKNNITEDQALLRIREGAGKMPPFARVLNGKEKAIVDFLFDKINIPRHRSNEDLKEIQNNRLSNIKMKDTGVAKDTGVIFLNTNAYVQMHDASDRPVIKPPYATLNAIDLSSGEYLWSVPAGNMKDLQRRGDPPTGAEGSPGPIVTAGGLIFLGGGHDRKFQAYDKTNGKLVWEVLLPAYASSSPSSFSSNGRQYIAISVAGDTSSRGGRVMVFSL